ncbi:MAG: ABC transporter permease subunit [Gammaproteobacteria bacterium]|nr:ABC transporter permease subunit [Gammaproteobacteria bacterium]
MTSYFIRRFLLTAPTFIGITLLVFVVTRFVPGGPIERMLMAAQFAAEGPVAMRSMDKIGGSPLSEDQLQQLREYYGFDKPVVQSYFFWLGKVLQLDLGVSTRYSDPVWRTIQERLPVSIFYGLATLILTYGICIPLGIVKAIKHNTAIDHLSSVLVFIGYAVPGFVVGIILIIAFASSWEIFPLGGFVSDNFTDLNFIGKTIDLFYHAVLPLIAYVSGSFAVMTFMMKNALMENLAADYLRTAMAKGLPFNQAVLKHALRNSLIPIATTFGQNISFFLTGAFLIEKVFNIDGIGLLGYESLVERDYPVVMGILAISAFLFLLGNILSDICVAMIDPRVKFGSK